MALTQARLKELLNYDPETGVFTWKVSASNRVKVGAIAGAAGSSGYRSIQVNRKLYLAHRLAWLFMTGSWPANLIDHIDGTETNNRFANLREATQCQNLQNRKIRTCLAGVSLRNSGVWRAKITSNKVVHQLGNFSTSAAAHAAYLAAKQQLHGEFAR